MNNKENPPTINKKAEPKSGCTRMIPAGNKQINKGARYFLFLSFIDLARIQAKKPMTDIFTNSAGCKLNPPIWIQLCEPFRTIPSPGM